MSLLAVSGDNGCDHDLGTVGQHAARWLRQPRRDDILQSLCPRRGRRLAVSNGRWTRSCRTWLSPDRGASTTRWRVNSRLRATPHFLWDGRMFVGDSRWKDSNKGDSPTQHDRDRDPAW